MSPQEYGRGSFFGNGGRRNGWLVPLLVGLGIGALLFGLLPGLHWGPGDRRPDRYGGGNTGGMFRQQPAPSEDQGAAAPQGRFGFEHGHSRALSGHGSWLPGALFFPFGGSQLILPLLLIGSGAWLLTRRRGGLGGPAYAPPRQSPPAPPADPEPRRDPEPPATGETRQLNRKDPEENRWL